MSLQDMLGRMQVIEIGGAETGGTESVVHPEAAIETLVAVAERYAAGCAFKEGDLITPRKGYGLRHSGLPHIVLEVFEQPVRLFKNLTSDEIGSPSAPARLDMRTAALYGDEVVSHFSESWRFETYVLPVAAG